MRRRQNTDSNDLMKETTKLHCSNIQVFLFVFCFTHTYVIPLFLSISLTQVLQLHIKTVRVQTME